MSYILEALKKAEKRRREELTSSQLYHTHPKKPLTSSQHTGLRTWLILSAVISVIIFSISLYYHSDLKAPAPDLRQSNSEQEAEKTNENNRGTIQIKPLSVLESKSRMASVVSLNEKDSGNTVLQPAPLVADEKIKQYTAISHQHNYPSIPSLKDLEPDIRESVPAFRLAGHVYSEASDLRMIIINNRVVREKDIVEKDYILEEITPDGIIMRLGEIRFHLPAD
ncbi:MAG TPA: general secretion pathway protein GspB [Desulfopila sp.]|nr:general secretion pathway protein GspB [Desulfopila sp.]